jgi:hypothetical protein
VVAPAVEGQEQQLETGVLEQPTRAAEEERVILQPQELQAVQAVQVLLL